MTNYSRHSHSYTSSPSWLLLCLLPLPVPKRTTATAIIMRLAHALAVTVFVLLILNCPNVAVDAKYVESCEKSYPTINPAEISLHCQLRTLNTDFNQLNLSTITSSSPDSIVSLSLLCSHVLFYQSSLSTASFHHFTNLHTLSIEQCKLSRLEAGVFDGLEYLKNLTINTHNTAWPALSLDLSPGVLNTASTLQRIDLSQNNIWTLPDRVFCPATALEYLNVSLNRLQDIGDLGFRERESEEQPGPDAISTSTSTSCQMNLRILDISYNRLILLPSSGLERLQNLQELYLQGNEISAIAGHALKGLKQLHVLNLGYNRITSLPENLFSESSWKLTEIYLQNNSIRSLTVGIFSMLSHLQVLDLSHNHLTSLEPVAAVESFTTTSEVISATNIQHQFELSSSSSYHIIPDGHSIDHLSSPFSDLGHLVSLHLGYNQITRISSNTFQSLNSLEILNLEHNQIMAIEPDAFESLTNLHTLILSHNQLTFVEGRSLNGLSALNQLSLDNNNITGIDRDAFQNCSGLKDLNLNGNGLTVEVENAIQNLTHLKTIDLGENQLEAVPHLIGLPNLYGLRLTGNRITNVSQDAFPELASLKILNLARNQLKFIQEGAFDSNLNLQALRLDANYLTDISNLFIQLPNLIWLNISDNQLSWFDYALIPKQLQWLDLHKNAISNLGNYFQVHDLKLTTLDASHNRISSLGAVNLPDSLEMVYLNDNLIRTIEPHTFLKKTNLSRIDLFGNQIETLGLTSLRLGQIPLDKPLPEMYLSDNIIVCVCNTEWLQGINNVAHLRQYFHVADLENIYCKIINENIVLRIVDVQPSQFLCQYANHCSNMCECCDSSACDCQQQCPQNCDCFNDDIWATNIVDCSNRGHTKLPAHIPMDVSQLYMDGNTIDELPSHALMGMKNLQILFLNNSGLTSLANNSMSSLRQLTTLHLEDNYIQKLHGFEFNDLIELKELYLQNNRLTFISNSTFVHLERLEVLRLDHNRLTHFEMWILSGNTNTHLVGINLSYNEWSCECEFLAQAMPWARTNIAKLDNPGSLTCNLYGRSFSLLYMNGTRCLDVTSVSSGGSHLSKDVKNPEPDSVSLSIFLIAVPLLLVIIGTIFFISRKCKADKTGSNCVLFKRARHTPGRQTNHFDVADEKLYDAYLCYGWKDDAWAQILDYTLSSNIPPYRLCLHYNLPKTAAYISDMILEGAESSRRTVLIISQNFLQDEWCQPDFKSGLRSAACTLHRNGNMFIIIILGELSPTKIDPDLQLLLQASIVLCADDKHFLTKLRAALPLPREPYSSSRSSFILPTTQPTHHSHKDQNLNLSLNSADYSHHQFGHHIYHSASEPTLEPLMVLQQTPQHHRLPSHGQSLMAQVQISNGIPRRPPPPLPPTPAEEQWGI